MPINETADVVIIGGGIVGSSIAYHLTEAGCTNVLIVEREAHQGLGSTGKSMGGVRAQFSTDTNIAMSRYSIDFYSRFEEVIGLSASYRPHGYLFLATTEQHVQYLNTTRQLQQQMGVTDVRRVDRREILEMVPQLSVDDVLEGSFCPRDGFVDPYSVMMGFATKAREHGARLWLGTEVSGIEVAEGRVASVMTSRGRVETRTVVNAAGPWAREIAAMAGVDLPVVPLRRQLVNTEPFDGVPAKFPMVIDMSNGFHFRREGPGLLMAWNDAEETPGFKLDFVTEFIEKVLVRAAARVPCLADVQVNPRRCWAGLYEMTPDHHCIIGAAPGLEGFYLANGFSGHGVMHSPATGKIASDLILTGESTLLDASRLNMSRFAEGKLLHEAALL